VAQDSRQAILLDPDLACPKFRCKAWLLRSRSFRAPDYWPPDQAPAW